MKSIYKIKIENLEKIIYDLNKKLKQEKTKYEELS